MTYTTNRVFGYHYFDGFKVDVFGYDPETERYTYSVETWYGSKVREAKAQYKAPDKRNPWTLPYGYYIHIVAPNGEKHRLLFDCR